MNLLALLLELLEVAGSVLGVLYFSALFAFVFLELWIIVVIPMLRLVFPSASLPASRVELLIGEMALITLLPVFSFTLHLLPSAWVSFHYDMLVGLTVGLTLHAMYGIVLYCSWTRPLWTLVWWLTSTFMVAPCVWLSSVIVSVTFSLCGLQCIKKLKNVVEEVLKGLTEAISANRRLRRELMRANSQLAELQKQESKTNECLLNHSRYLVTRNGKLQEEVQTLKDGIRTMGAHVEDIANAAEHLKADWDAKSTMYEHRLGATQSRERYLFNVLCRVVQDRESLKQSVVLLKDKCDKMEASLARSSTAPLAILKTDRTVSDDEAPTDAARAPPAAPSVDDAPVPSATTAPTAVVAPAPVIAHVPAMERSTADKSAPPPPRTRYPPLILLPCVVVAIALRMMADGHSSTPVPLATLLIRRRRTRRRRLARQLNGDCPAFSSND